MSLLKLTIQLVVICTTLYMMWWELKNSNPEPLPFSLSLPFVGKDDPDWNPPSVAARRDEDHPISYVDDDIEKTDQEGER